MGKSEKMGKSGKNWVKLLKKEINNIDNPIDKLMKLQPKQYYICDEKEQFNFLRHFQKKQNQDIYKFLYEKRTKLFYC